MNRKANRDISAFTLRLLAMGLMVCDHLWATVVPGQDWLTWIGRLAYPIFAFLLVEGYFHTRDYKKYTRRLLVFALLSEIPYNLLYIGGPIYPFQQNVLWTFLIALSCMRTLDKLREKWSPWLAAPLGALAAAGYCLIAQITMVDYFGYGVMMALTFYLFRGNGLWAKLGQLAGLVWINFSLMGGLQVPVELFGLHLEFPQQGMAVLALIPIWCYRGRQGPYGKGMRYGFYAFYPAHMVLLWLLSQML